MPKLPRNHSADLLYNPEEKPEGKPEGDPQTQRRAPSYGHISNRQVHALCGSQPGTSPYQSINNTTSDRKDIITFGRQFIILQRAFNKLRTFKNQRLPTHPDRIRAWMLKQDGNDLYNFLRTIPTLYNLNPTQAQKFIDAIRGYCGDNTIKLPDYKRFAPKNKRLPVPKKNHARTILSFIQDKRHKLIAYLQAESGLAIHTVLQLKNKHILNDYNNNIRPIFIELDPQSYIGKHPEGLTFLSPKALSLYEQLRKENKISGDPEAYLLINTTTNTPLKYTTVRGVFKRAITDARTFNPEIDPKLQPTHCLVKYFNNALDTAGLSQTRQKIINGHNNGVQDNYTDHDIELARKDYADAYPFIDIDDPTDPSTIKEKGAQDRQINDLQTKYSDLLHKYETLQQQFSQTLTTGMHITAKLGTELISEQLHVPPQNRPEFHQLFMELSEQAFQSLPTDTKLRILTGETTPDDRILSLQANLPLLTALKPNAPELTAKLIEILKKSSPRPQTTAPSTT